MNGGEMGRFNDGSKRDEPVNERGKARRMKDCAIALPKSKLLRKALSLPKAKSGDRFIFLAKF